MRPAHFMRRQDGRRSTAAQTTTPSCTTKLTRPERKSRDLPRHLSSRAMTRPPPSDCVRACTSAPSSDISLYSSVVKTFGSAPKHRSTRTESASRSCAVPALSEGSPPQAVSTGKSRSPQSGVRILHRTHTRGCRFRPPTAATGQGDSPRSPAKNGTYPHRVPWDKEWWPASWPRSVRRLLRHAGRREDPILDSLVVAVAGPPVGARGAAVELEDRLSPRVPVPRSTTSCAPP